MNQCTRKRRKCAILTDSPEKAAIEQHTMKQKKGGRPKAKQMIIQAKRRLSARNNKKKKAKGYENGFVI